MDVYMRACMEVYMNRCVYVLMHVCTYVPGEQITASSFNRLTAVMLSPVRFSSNVCATILLMFSHVINPNLSPHVC